MTVFVVDRREKHMQPQRMKQEQQSSQSGCIRSLGYLLLGLGVIAGMIVVASFLRALGGGTTARSEPASTMSNGKLPGTANATRVKAGSSGQALRIPHWSRCVPGIASASRRRHGYRFLKQDLLWQHAHLRTPQPRGTLELDCGLRLQSIAVG
jgi:hypothetical protein